MKNRSNTFFARFVTNAAISLALYTSASAATYYWDNNGTTTGFGTAAGTWAAPTTGSATQGWSTDSTGATLPGSVTTATTDTLNFGTATAGLAAGTVTVSTVSSGSINFGAASGAIVLSGGTITLAAATTITVNSAGTNGISSILAGSSSVLTKAGTGLLQLTGVNTFGGGLTVNEGTILAQTSASTLGNSGTGTVKLGSTTAGTNNVTLALGTSGVFNNPIIVQSGNSGTVTITNYANYSPTLAATVTMNKALTISNTNSSGANTLSVSGKLTGTGALTLTGSNAADPIVLSNSGNDFTGTTSINSGTIRLTGNLGNTAVTVASGAYLAGEGSIGATGSLTFNNGSFLRVDGSTAGALSVGSGATGNLTLAATTTVVLDGVPAATGTATSFRLLNYNGSLTGNAANLALQNAANYRGYAFSTATANQVNMTIDTKAITWSGATAVWDINSTSNWESGTDKFYQGDAVTFTDTGTTKAVTLGVAVTPASVTFNNSTGNDYTLTSTGAIGGGTLLTKSNTGTVTISTANTYSGGTSITGGKIIATVANALGTGSVANNANLDLTGGALTYTGLSTGLSGNGTVNVTLGTGSGATILNGDYSGFTGTWNIGIGASAGAGKVQMNGADNSSSTLNILTHGTVYVSATVTKNGAIVLNGGDTGESLGQLRLEGGANWAGPVTLAGDITGTGDFTVGSNTGTGTISGSIGESGGSRALTKGGGGSITISGTNTYTGLTTVIAGTLKLGGVGALGNGTLNTSGLTASGSGILDLGGITTTATVPLTLNSSAGGFDVGCFYNTGGNVTYAGTVTLSANTRVGAGNILLNNTLTGNSKNLMRDGVGTLELANSGTVTLAALQANRGTIQVDSGSTLNVTSIDVGTGSSVGAGLILNGGTVTSSGTSRFGNGSGSASGYLTLNGGTLTVPALTKGSVTFNVYFNGGTLKAYAGSTSFFATATSAKVQSGGAKIDDGGFAITIAQPLIEDTTSTGGGLAKSGSGTLTLNGADTYTGSTTINAGTLALGASGSIASTSVSIAAGAALDTTAKTTYTSPASLAFGVDSSGTSGQINATGKALVISGSAVTFNVTGTLTAPAYVLATYGTISGTAAFSSATPPTGYTINYSYNSGTQIALVAIPTDPFKNWIDTFGLTSGQKGKASDPDNDGLDNLGEFALDGNPNSGANNGKVVTQEATVGTDKVLTLTLPVRTGATFTNVGGALQSAAVDGVVYTIQGSGDLSDWSLHVTEITPALSTGLPALSVIPGDTGSWTYRTFRSPGVIGTDAKQFLRVKIEQAP